MYPNHCSQYDHSSDVRDDGDLPINHLTQGVGQLNLNCRTPELINTHTHYCKTQPNDPPVQVIPYVFLGNYYNAKDLKCLKGNKISFILNVTDDLPNTFENEHQKLRYHRVAILDRSSQDLMSLLPAAFAFIGK